MLTQTTRMLGPCGRRPRTAHRDSQHAWDHDSLPAPSAASGCPPGAELNQLNNLHVQASTLLAITERKPV
jgi:hypothetical protein